MKTNLYTNVVLTVIAALLAWHALVRDPISAVHAQKRHIYRAVLLSFVEFEKPASGEGNGPLIPFEKRLNEAAQGQRLVDMIRNEDGYQVIAVFEQE